MVTHLRSACRVEIVVVAFLLLEFVGWADEGGVVSGGTDDDTGFSALGAGYVPVRERIRPRHAPKAHLKAIYLVKLTSHVKATSAIKLTKLP